LEEDPDFDTPTAALTDRKTPSDLTVQIMETQGVAVIDDKDGIRFNIDWTSEQVQQKLQKLFPVLFMWLSCDSESLLASRHHFAVFCQPWVICFRERTRLEVVNHITHPTGKA
jgi:hypothetical protein